jgi:protein involved in polysaccharide export with SLBB domain
MGEVMKPGKYELFDGMTLRDLIIRAGGFKVGVDMGRGDFTRPVKTANHWEVERYVIDLQAAMDNEPGKNPKLRPGDVLAVRSTPDWKRDNIVRVSGEVLYPGEYTFEPGERISDLIKRAGGYTPRAYLPAAYFKRISALAQQQQQIALIKRNTQLEQKVEAMRIASARAEEEDSEVHFDQAQLQMMEQLGSSKPTGRMVVEIEDTKEFIGSRQDLKLEPGDELSIPQRPSTVVVEGAVGNPTALSWQPNKNMLYYINKAGGVSRYGNRDAARLIRADGSALAATGRHRPAHSFLGTKVEPGDVIWVPVDMRPRRASRWKKAIDLTQILGNLAVTYIAIDNASR